MNRMEPDSPWLTGIQYMEAIGAVCSLYPQEVEKKSVTGRPLRQMLLTAASPVKFQWLLNDTRYRHACSRRQLKLLPSGTTSNESLHHELNYRFRETQQIHRPTLELKLQFFCLSKLLSHNFAMYHTTQRQMTSKDVLHRLLGAMSIWTTSSWAKWCKSQRRCRGTMLEPAALPLAAQKRAVSQAIKLRKKPASNVRIRPAGAPPTPPRPTKQTARRRTVFTLRRARSLLHQGNRERS